MPDSPTIIQCKKIDNDKWYHIKGNDLDKSYYAESDTAGQWIKPDGWNEAKCYSEVIEGTKAQDGFKEPDLEHGLPPDCGFSRCSSLE